METQKAIMTRKSIRKYKPDPVPNNQIEKLLEAAMQAPSAGNQQPWHFVVITDKALLEHAAAFSPYAKFAKDAPLAILVCGDTSTEKYKGFWVQDCSAAVQNILISANDLGLGTCWTAAYPLEDRAEGFRKLLSLPEGVVALALITLGYPAERPVTEKRYKKERIHYNKW